MSPGPSLQTTEELNVGTIDSMAGLLALEDEWRALEQRLPRLPFLTFDWCVTWWEHFAERRLLVTDSLHVLTFRDAQGALVAIAPLMLTRAPGVAALSVRQLQLFGADPNVTEIRSLVVSPEHEAQVYAALMRHLQLRSRHWDWLLLNGVPDEASLASTIEQSFTRVEWRRALPNYTLALSKTFAEFKSSRSRNIKESLRKCYNSLKRDGLTFEFRVLTSAADVDLALTELFRLHRLRSQLTDTVAHPDTFAAESSRRFLRALCQRLALRERVRLFQLIIDGQVVATRVAFVCQDCLYFYYSGYEPAFGRYSVMTTLLAEALRYAIEQGMTSANLATGRDVGKQRWSPEEKVYRDVLVVSPALRGGIAYGACSLAKRALAAAQERTTLFDWLGRRAEPRAARPTPVDTRTQSQAPPAQDTLAAE